MLKKVLKISAIVLGSVISLALLAFGILYITLNTKIPEGTSGKDADEFAEKMLAAVHHDAYNKTRYIQWTFRGKNHYVWDKDQGTVQVKWDEYKIDLNLSAPGDSKVLDKGTLLSGTEKQKIIDSALKNFHNDSFWIVAPHKLFDSGTTRRLVTLDDGSKALLVIYSSGGTTPGDSYLWKTDKNYVPKSYQMWVSIIPIGGIEVTWEDWKTTQSGTLLPGKHELLGLDIPISNIKGWN